MADSTPAPTAETAEDWDARDRDNEAYPELPLNPHNHIYTVSMDGRGPMIVVRGSTPAEINERYQALLDAGVTTVAASVYSHMKAEMNLAQGLGPVSPVPAPQTPPTPPAVPAFPQPPQQFPQQGGQAPAAWQNVGAPQGPSPEYGQAGWYRLSVPFPQKGTFDGITAQYQMRKGRPSEGGSFSFEKSGKSWYVAPEYAGAFPMFNPVPA